MNAPTAPILTAIHMSVNRSLLAMFAIIHDLSTLNLLAGEGIGGWTWARILPRGITASSLDSGAVVSETS
jgi:hypothetical protein